MLWSKGLSKFMVYLIDEILGCDIVCCAIRLHALTVGLEFVDLAFLLLVAIDHEKVSVNLVLCSSNSNT